MESKEEPPNHQPPNGPIVVAPKTLRRFYENVVYLDVLNQGLKNSTRKRPVEPLQGEDLEDEALFHSFVWRLGQICDSSPGGFTVTAFVVLQQPGRIQYVFGSNKRTTTELKITKAYIESILGLLAEAADCENDEKKDMHQAGLLRDVLGFNRGRVSCYLSALRKALESCIAICQNERSSPAATHTGILQAMLESVLNITAADIDDDEYFERIKNFIGDLEHLYQRRSTTAHFVQKRASNDKVGNPEPWREFRHHSGRLMAYKRAIQVLWHSGFMWPELCRGFEVTPLRSSAPGDNPLGSEPQKAVDILKRHKLPETEELRYLEMAEELQQKFHLNNLILERWTKKSFRPFVHAEILVLNWLENNGGTRPERFFNGWRYIGSSKPACKLCSYYLSSHPSRVQYRSPHGNIYISWRMPDLMDVHGAPNKKAALDTRHQILQDVGTKVREDVLRSLSDKLTDRRPHDSATNSTFPAQLMPVSGGSLITDMEDLTRAEDASDAGGAATEGGDLLDPLLQELK